jgi:hypothetical protein
MPRHWPHARCCAHTLHARRMLQQRMYVERWRCVNSASSSGLRAMPMHCDGRITRGHMPCFCITASAAKLQWKSAQVWHATGAGTHGYKLPVRDLSTAHRSHACRCIAMDVSSKYDPPCMCIIASAAKLQCKKLRRPAHAVPSSNARQRTRWTCHDARPAMLICTIASAAQLQHKIRASATSATGGLTRPAASNGCLFVRELSAVHYSHARRCTAIVVLQTLQAAKLQRNIKQHQCKRDKHNS